LCHGGGAPGKPPAAAPGPFGPGLFDNGPGLFGNAMAR